MTKTKVTLDLTDSNVQTPSGRITSPLEVTQHLRAQFCSRQWKKERMNMNSYAMTKTKVTLDLTDGNVQTPSGRMFVCYGLGLGF
jgi:hypothetical protein